MRINPLGNYSDVQRLVSQPAHVPERGSLEFEQTLAGVAKEIEGTQIVRAQAEPSVISPKPAVAQISIPEPQLKVAQLEAVPVPRPPDSAVEESSEPKDGGVRSPSLVSATRVLIPDRYAGLSRSQKEEAVESLVREAGARHGIDPVLSFAVVAVESSFDHRAVSNDGHESKGLMQLLDSTGRAQLRLAESGDKYDPFHPPLNVDLGVRYLRELHDMFAQPTQITKDLSTIAAANSSSLEKLAVASYNAGQGRVAAAQHRAEQAGKDPGLYTDVEAYLPQSTQEYVRRVMDRRERYVQRFGPQEDTSTG